MLEIVEPEAVFSKREIKNLQRWISVYNNPLKPAIVVAVTTFLAAIVTVIALVQLQVAVPDDLPWPDIFNDGIQEGLFLFSCVTGVFAFIAARVVAVRVFARYDRCYFRRTGITETEYLDCLIDEAKREAAIRFAHEMPNGRDITMFQFPEEQQKEALELYKSQFVKDCAAEEKRLRFKAYMARRLGFSIPLKRDAK